MKKLLFFLILISTVVQCKKEEIAKPFQPTSKVFGLNFGPYEGDQDPSSGIILSEGQLEVRLALLKGYTEYIRIFGATHGLEAIPSIAVSEGFKVYASAWLSSDQAANEMEIASLIEIGKSGNAKALIVGSEVLLRGDLSPAQLIGYIDQVRAALPGIPVSTADRYDQMLENPDVMEACDFLFINIYPFWDGESVECAVYKVQQAWQSVKDLANGKEVILSECGWPTGGLSIGNAAPTPENACLFLSQLANWCKTMNVKSFLFEAFDEPWKANYEGEIGAHWGIFDKEGKIKECMTSLFDDEMVVEYSDCPSLSPPVAFFTVVPPIGSQANLSGCTEGVNPANFSMVIVIKVNGQWWVKPYSASRKTPIGEDGCWTTDITTGGNDASATEICAYLIPKTFNPPDIIGELNVPSELEDFAIARVCVTR